MKEEVRSLLGEKKIIKKILIAVVLVVAAAGGVLFYKNHIAMNPGDTLLKYMSYAEEGEYEKMYQMLDEESQKGISREDFISRNQKIYEGISMKNLDVTITSKKRDTTVAYRVEMRTSAGKIKYGNKTSFVKENRRYRVKWDDSMIFPHLGAEDKVRVKTLYAKRGEIKDRKGNLLAGEGRVYSVGLVPGKMDQQTIGQAAKLLGMTKEEIQKKLDQKWVNDESFVPLVKMEEYPKELLNIAGVMVSTETDRIYPLGEAAAHLTGYVQNQEGKTGLEKLYDKHLSGTNGVEICILNAEGEKKQSLAVKAQNDGKDLETTIDSKLQLLIYEQYKSDQSAHAAINPYSGEVRALVSTPSYDNQAISWGISTDQWNKIQNDSRNPMQNRWKGTWCPGSSLKPVIGAIGLTEKKFTVTEDFGDTRTQWQKDKSWGGYYVTTLHGYKNHNLTNAMIYSDNIYFAKAALKIGENTLKSELDQLGFGKEMPFVFGLSASSYGADGFTSEIQLADSGYGQGQMMVNPVHMASIYSAFSNGGNMLKMRLVKEKDSEKQIWKKQVFSEEAVKSVRYAMNRVVEDPNGTGHGVIIPGISVIGKTGTAEIKKSKEDTKGTELGWFVTIAEKTNQTEALELVSVTEDVKNRGGSGYVVSKTKNILTSYLQQP